MSSSRQVRVAGETGGRRRYASSGRRGSSSGSSREDRRRKRGGDRGEDSSRHAQRRERDEEPSKIRSERRRRWDGPYESKDEERGESAKPSSKRIARDGATSDPPVITPAKRSFSDAVKTAHMRQEQRDLREIESRAVEDEERKRKRGDGRKDRRAALVSSLFDSAEVGKKETATSSGSRGEAGGPPETESKPSREGSTRFDRPSRHTTTMLPPAEDRQQPGGGDTWSNKRGGSPEARPARRSRDEDRRGQRHRVRSREDPEDRGTEPPVRSYRRSPEPPEPPRRRHRHTFERESPGRGSSRQQRQVSPDDASDYKSTRGREGWRGGYRDDGGEGRSPYPPSSRAAGSSDDWTGGRGGAWQSPPRQQEENAKEEEPIRHPRAPRRGPPRNRERGRSYTPPDVHVEEGKESLNGGAGNRTPPQWVWQLDSAQIPPPHAGAFRGGRGRGRGRFHPGTDFRGYSAADRMPPSEYMNDNPNAEPVAKIKGSRRGGGRGSMWRGGRMGMKGDRMMRRHPDEMAYQEDLGVYGEMSDVGMEHHMMNDYVGEVGPPTGIQPPMGDHRQGGGHWRPPPGVGGMPLRHAGMIPRGHRPRGRPPPPTQPPPFVGVPGPNFAPLGGPAGVPGVYHQTPVGPKRPMPPVGRGGVVHWNGHMVPHKGGHFPRGPPVMPDRQGEGPRPPGVPDVSKMGEHFQPPAPPSQPYPFVPPHMPLLPVRPPPGVMEMHAATTSSGTEEKDEEAHLSEFLDRKSKLVDFCRLLSPTDVAVCDTVLRPAIASLFSPDLPVTPEGSVAVTSSGSR